jgi:hypothetical protein
MVSSSSMKLMTFMRVRRKSTVFVKRRPTAVNRNSASNSDNMHLANYTLVIAFQWFYLPFQKVQGC